MESMTEPNIGVRPLVSADTCAPSTGFAFVRILASTQPADQGTSVSAALTVALARRVDGVEGGRVSAQTRNPKSALLPMSTKGAFPGPSAWSPPV